MGGGGKGRGVEGNRWEEKKIGSDKEREMLGVGRKKWRMEVGDEARKRGEGN